MSKPKKTIVIGAGIGGIAAAIRLKLKGHDVQIFEKNDFAGGKLSEIRSEGYRFDAGPSLFTLPYLVDELFLLAGKNPRNYFSYDKLEIICKYFYEDGTVLYAYQDVHKFAKELASKTAVTERAVHMFLKQSKILYDLTSEVFIFNSFHKLKTFYSKPFIKAFLQLYKLKALTTMHRDNSIFFNDHRVVQLFDRYATYNGSNPYTAPGTLNVIPHLEHTLGAFFPENGMYSIIDSMVKLADEIGIPIYFNENVKKIKHNGKKVTGIETERGNCGADAVISDIDIVKLYELLENVPIKRRYLNEEKSTSALIFYWGLNKTFPDLELHNILFSGNYEKEFQHLFLSKTVYGDPTIYIFISSKNVTTDALPDGENWFVMINTPENTGQDWDKIINTMKPKIQQKINKMLNMNIQDHIVTERIMDPRSIEKRTSSYLGALYGSSSNNKFAAFRRHPNFSTRLKGLYFVGGSVHPGGGIPLCLASAKIVGDLIKS